MDWPILARRGFRSSLPIAATASSTSSISVNFIFRSVRLTFMRLCFSGFYMKLCCLNKALAGVT